MLNWLKAGRRIAGASLRQVEVNGGPGALLLDGDERVICVWSLEIAGGYIQGIKSVINPEKLQHLGPITDWSSFLP